jgi:hypothetical protein
VGLLLLLKRRRVRRNAGHADFACAQAIGSGRVAVARRRVGARVLRPGPPLPVIGRGGAAFAVTEAVGHGSVHLDDLLLQLLLVAAA